MGPVITMVIGGYDDYLFSVYYSYMLGSTAGMAFPTNNKACTNAALYAHGIWSLVMITAFSAWLTSGSAFLIQGLLRLWEAITCSDVPADVEERLGAFDPQ